MSDLDTLRAEIDKIDHAMTELFEKRMETVSRIARFKQQHAMEILDASRETAVIEKNSAKLCDQRLKPYYAEYMHCFMDVSKRYQRQLITGQEEMIVEPLGRQPHRAYPKWHRKRLRAGK